MRKYIVSHRYNYYAVDEYIGENMVRYVDSGFTRKAANAIAQNMGIAHSDGIFDALVGLTLKLRQRLEVEVAPSQKITLRAGTLIRPVAFNNWELTLEIVNLKRQVKASKYDVDAACREKKEKVDAT